MLKFHRFNQWHLFKLAPVSFDMFTSLLEHFLIHIVLFFLQSWNQPLLQAPLMPLTKKNDIVFRILLFLGILSGQSKVTYVYIHTRTLSYIHIYIYICLSIYVSICWKPCVHTNAFTSKPTIQSSFLFSPLLPQKELTHIKREKTRMNFVLLG